MEPTCPHCSQEHPAGHPALPGSRCPFTGKLIDSFAPGAVLDGKFEIVRELARGGMGVVYVARHLALDRQVAVKVLLGELASDLELAARFEQEARAATAIGHPHIIHVYDLGRTSGGLLYMVMELLEGQSLATLLADSGRLPVSRALRLVDQVLSALGAAHKRGIVHRDLKPDNIFVMQTEYQPDFVKLLDFGISKILAAGAPGGLAGARKQTRMGTVMGTPEYMAPEQAAGQVDQVDARSDLYATGVVLYELLSGETPFQGDNYNAIMAAIIDGAHVRVRERRPAISATLDAVVEQAIQPAREARFASAADMRDALAAAAQGEDAGRATGAAPVLELDDDDDDGLLAEGSGVLAAVGSEDFAPVLELPSFSVVQPPAAAPAPVAAAAAAPAGPAASAEPVRRADPFAPPADLPVSALVLDTPTPRTATTAQAHGTPRPMALAPARATPPPRAAPVRAPAPLVRTRRAGRFVVWLVLVLAAGVGSFVAYRKFGDRLPFLAPADVRIAVAVAPAGAELRLDGQPASPGTLALRPGRHELSATAPGHVARRLLVDARAGATLSVLLVPTIAPVSASDPTLAGQPMPPPLAADAAAAATAPATLAKLARARECTDPITLATPPDPAALDANQHWSLDAAARCLDEARTLPPALPTLDAASARWADSLRKLAATSRTLAGGKRAPTPRQRRDLTAAHDAARAADEPLRRALLAADEHAQQALLTPMPAAGSTFGFAARRYVLGAIAAFRRGDTALAQPAYDELLALCRQAPPPGQAEGRCDPLLLAATAYRQDGKLSSLNAVVAAYDRLTTD